MNVSLDSISRIEPLLSQGGRPRTGTQDAPRRSPGDDATGNRFNTEQDIALLAAWRTNILRTPYAVAWNWIANGRIPNGGGYGVVGSLRL